MVKDPAAKLFGSLARVRLMRLFLFSPKHLFTLEDAALRTRLDKKEVRLEILALKEAGLLRCARGKAAKYGLEEHFPYLSELQHILLNSTIRQKTVHERLRKAGSVKFIGVAGVFMGDLDSRLDLIVAGDRLSEAKIRSAVKALEADLGAQLQYASLSTSDLLYRLTISDRFVRDFFDYPHLILLDRINLGRS